MPWFRTPSDTATPLTAANLRQAVADVLRPEHFFAAADTRLEFDSPAAETVPWELFQGRLLDGPMTRERRTFESWNVFLTGPEGRSAEPLLSLKLDAAAGELYVVRSILCYAWETYSEGNVVHSRETRRWVRELVGTVRLERFGTVEELRDELVCLLFQAVVGTSRLPLTSVEAPLPAFSFGRLAYVYTAGGGRERPEGAPRGAHAPRPPRQSIDLAAGPELTDLERAKLLEVLLHATPAEELSALADAFPTPLPVLRTLFNEVSLSPYTDLVDRALAFLTLARERGRVTPAEAADFLTGLLLLIGRHLTAFDLITFHHRGANYPDALLLDAILKASLTMARRHPDLFSGDAARPRRRGLRQGWLLRRRYEGLPVPDAPTSQGENLRVLPEPFRRVADEQILQPHRRRRQLFADRPLSDWLSDADRDLLRLSLADLAHAGELRELGTALFLDRPLGAPKGPLEPDATPLLSYAAFSRSLALRRLEELAQGPLGLDNDTAVSLRKTLEALTPGGVPVRGVASRSRPGTVALADARQVAEDFVLLRTTALSAARFWRLFPPEPLRRRFDLASWDPHARTLILGAAPPPGETRVRLTVCDDRMRSRIEVVADAADGYVRRAGVEYPAAGLRVLRVWEDAGQELRQRDLGSEDVRLAP